MVEDTLNMGIINVDKPSGPTSFSVTEYVRESLGINKASHMGTLDPKVTGVLPITLGRACRLADFFIRHDKTYVGVLHVHKKQNIKKLQEIINEKFTGEIIQIPPHKSSVKRAPRKRKVYYFKLIETSDERNFLFECKVEGGTYIRKICSDLGEIIGGAHMAELRRIKAGIFGEENMCRLDYFDKAAREFKEGRAEKLASLIIPAKKAIAMVLPKVLVEKRALKSLFNGKPLFKRDVISFSNCGDDNEASSNYAAAFCDDVFVGVYLLEKSNYIFGRPRFVNN